MPENLACRVCPDPVLDIDEIVFERPDIELLVGEYELYAKQSTDGKLVPLERPGTLVISHPLYQDSNAALRSESAASGYSDVPLEGEVRAQPYLDGEFTVAVATADSDDTDHAVYFIMHAKHRRSIVLGTDASATPVQAPEDASGRSLCVTKLAYVPAIARERASGVRLRSGDLLVAAKVFGETVELLARRIGKGIADVSEDVLPCRVASPIHSIKRILTANDSGIQVPVEIDYKRTRSEEFPTPPSH